MSREHNLIEVIKQVANEKPFLGICLGLQLLFDHTRGEQDNFCLTMYKHPTKV